MIKGYIGKDKEKKEYKPLLFQEIYIFFKDAPKKALKLFWHHLKNKQYREAINLLKQFLKLDISEDVIKQFLEEEQVQTQGEQIDVSSKKKFPNNGFIPRELPYGANMKKSKNKKYWKYTKPAENISPTGFDSNKQNIPDLFSPIANKNFNKLFIISCDEREEESNHVKWAIDELKYAKLLDNDDDPELEKEFIEYNKMVAESVISVLKEFSKAGHSGFSSSMAIELLNKLLKYQNLTPLTDNPEEWMDIADMMDGNIMYQSRRNPACFTENMKQYYNIDDPDGKEKLYDLIKFENEKNLKEK
jgi:hypothetical protein